MTELIALSVIELHESGLTRIADCNSIAEVEKLEGNIRGSLPKIIGSRNFRWKSNSGYVSCPQQCRQSDVIWTAKKISHKTQQLQSGVECRGNGFNDRSSLRLFGLPQFQNRRATQANEIVGASDS